MAKIIISTDVGTVVGTIQVHESDVNTVLGQTAIFEYLLKATNAAIDIEDAWQDIADAVEEMGLA